MTNFCKENLNKFLLHEQFYPKRRPKVLSMTKGRERELGRTSNIGCSGNGEQSAKSLLKIPHSKS